MTEFNISPEELQAFKLYDKYVGDEGLFPNHTDKDIWISGAKAVLQHVNKIILQLPTYNIIIEPPPESDGLEITEITTIEVKMLQYRLLYK